MFRLQTFMAASPHEFGKVLTEDWEEFLFIPPADKTFDVAFFHDQFVISENHGATIYVLSMNKKSYNKGMMLVEKYFNMNINNNQQLS